jgi:hypothetical protein
MNVYSPSRPNADPIALDLPPLPYPGLRPFSGDEWAIFFGREQMIDKVRDLLATQRLVVVHGSSGCGKSSLIRAGVLPRLSLDYERYSLPPLRAADIRPGTSPLWNLAKGLATLTGAPADDDGRSDHVKRIRALLNRGEAALDAVVQDFGLGKDGDACLVIDQFEELFRYGREFDRAEAEIFVKVLKRCDPGLPAGLSIIVTMRSDYLGECGRFPGFAELINRTQYLVPRMDDGSLVRAIREPARLYGGEVTRELATRLVRDSGGELDALPLVQHCLMRLWPRPQNAGLTRPRLDLSSYLGLRASLSKHADAVLKDLEDENPAYVRITEFVFRALTDMDPEGRAVRRPLKFSDLLKETCAFTAKIAEAEDSIEAKDTTEAKEAERITKEKLAAEIAAVTAVVEAFQRMDQSFLTVNSSEPGTHPLSDQDVIDISHEALIRC